MTHDRANTWHIQACRAKFHEHVNSCKHCSLLRLGAIETDAFCEMGQVVYQEYIYSILASPDVEVVEV